MATWAITRARACCNSSPTPNSTPDRSACHPRPLLGEGRQEKRDEKAGASFAPYAAAVLDLAREEWALPIPAVEPAQTDTV